jgi:hypothetical protein
MTAIWDIHGENTMSRIGSGGREEGKAGERGEENRNRETVICDVHITNK